MRRFKKCLVDTKYSIRFWLDVTDRKEDRINVSSSEDGWMMVISPR